MFCYQNIDQVVYYLQDTEGDTALHYAAFGWVYRVYRVTYEQARYSNVILNSSYMYLLNKLTLFQTCLACFVYWISHIRTLFLSNLTVVICVVTRRFSRASRNAFEHRCMMFQEYFLTWLSCVKRLRNNHFYPIMRVMLFFDVKWFNSWLFVELFIYSEISL